MGRNGAGKSTLLRIIAGTLDATAGSVITAGRVAAILELGTGFHADYSGRENIYLGGLCLGLSRKQIDSRVAEVIEFSELDEFIDQPFRTYSSGMQARLAFSVATCVDPDILIIDEALSVGDARFQLKSFDRIREFKRRGKSILVVSHSINQLVSVCDRAILLDRGRILMDGEPNAVGNAYHELLFGPPAAAELALPPAETQADGGGRQTESPEPAAAIDRDLAESSPERAGANGGREHRYGDGAARIIDFRLLDADGRAVTRLQSLETYAAAVTIRAVRQTEELCAGVLVRNARGQDIFATDMMRCQDLTIAPLAPGEEAVVRMRFRANIASGTYFFSAALARYDTLKHDVRFDAIMVEVEPILTLFTDIIVNLEPEFLVERRNNRHELPPRIERVLPAEAFTPETGYAWTVPVAEFSALADTAERPVRSPLLLLEDGMPLGPPHAAHAQIRSRGRGRYSHWGETLYFATSDNSPPDTNGRTYTLLVPATAVAGRLVQAVAITMQPDAEPLCADPG
jgi:lipopolysaccharide transport system ATP-binding protein